MMVLAGADLLLADGIRTAGTLVIEGDRIVDVASDAGTRGAGDHVDLTGHLIVPGFIDVHVHGVEGTDTLDSAEAVVTISRALTKYGVTSFCPTTVACAPTTLRKTLQGVHDARTQGAVRGSRVLGAHLESNFINPAYKGAQPETDLCLPSSPDAGPILDEIQRARPDVAIVTLAPELPGGLGLVKRLVHMGIRVSLGHSGATFETAEAAIDAGARQATHLFNRMPPLNHRDPGLAGAVLTRREVAAEVICDGVHVHGPMIQLAIAAKGTDRIMAITDGTAAAGLPDGSAASLGRQRICVRNGAAYLDNGTLAGGVATMDVIFRFLVGRMGLSMNDASRLCSTTPAAELGLHGCGTIARDAIADLVVLDRYLVVKQTYVAGRLAFSNL